MSRLLIAFLALFIYVATATAQESTARLWNDVLLDAIRKDFARPTVHSRNLFHTSIGMYDLWAIFDASAGPYMLGSAGCPFEGMPLPADLQAARNEAISYATYGLLKHRFADSPGLETTLPTFDAQMSELGFDIVLVFSRVHFQLL